MIGSSEAPDRESDEVAVDVNAVITLARVFLPGMLARRSGGILNVASTAAFQPTPYQAVYGASKAFVLSFSGALWAEARGAGVAVTALCPGPTRTGFVDVLGADVAHTAMYNRLAEPEPVIEAGLRALRSGLLHLPRSSLCSAGVRVNQLRRMPRYACPPPRSADAIMAADHLSWQRLRCSSRLTSRNLGEPVNNRPFTLLLGSTSCGNRPVRRAISFASAQSTAVPSRARGRHPPVRVRK